MITSRSVLVLVIPIWNWYWTRVLVIGKFGIGHLADVFSSWLFSTVCFQMCPSMCPQLSHCRCIFQLAGRWYWYWYWIRVLVLVFGKFGTGHLVDVSSSWLDPRHSRNDLPRQIV